MEGGREDEKKTTDIIWKLLMRRRGERGRELVKGEKKEVCRRSI